MFALFVTTRKFYFQSFPIIVLAKYPLRTIVEDPEAIGRIAKWVTKIRPLRVTFELRTTIKGQILADFIAEYILGPHHRITP